MQAFTNLTSRVAVLPANDVDTDQIIPARYLKTIDKAGLGANLFADWRYLPDGSPNLDFPLNSPDCRGAQVLLAGHNFGCGSSREHAPWALAGFGFRVVISSAIADIFYNNALKNGLLPVVVDTESHRRMLTLFRANPKAELNIDLDAQTVSLPDGSVVGFQIDGFAKTCLLNGVDELGYILGLEDRIAAFEAKLSVGLPKPA